MATHAHTTTTTRGGTAPLAHLAAMLTNRRRIEALVAALIDVLDATDDPDDDLCVEDCNALGLHHGDGLAGDPDDAEASGGQDGWTVPADGVAFRQVVRVRTSARRAVA